MIVGGERVRAKVFLRMKAGVGPAGRATEYGCLRDVVKGGAGLRRERG